MGLNISNSAHPEKRNFIMFAGIFILAIITLLIPQSQFLDLSGGSAGVIEPPQMVPVANDPDKIDVSAENVQINMPEFETALRPMGKLNRKNHILYPEDASSYITPENEVVSWHAENTILTDDGLLWKHTGIPVEFKYRTDNELFNNPTDGDMWQNPDHYLANGNMGDCEDFSVAFASILEAKGIPAEVIGVNLINERRHWVVKYYFNEQINYADINPENVLIWHESNPTIDKEWISIDKEQIQKLA
jgi:hypothetical protein